MMLVIIQPKELAKFCNISQPDQTSKGLGTYTRLTVMWWETALKSVNWKKHILSNQGVKESNHTKSLENSKVLWSFEPRADNCIIIPLKTGFSRYCRCVIVAEIGKLRQTIEAENGKFERTRDDLEERLAKTENELQLALQNEKTAHEEDVERLSREKVGTVSYHQKLYKYPLQEQPATS